MKSGMTRIVIFVFVAMLTVMTYAAGLKLPADAEVAAEEISADSFRGHIRFLSDDLLEGRGPATRGDALTQLYLASEMESIGLEPGAEDGTWTQPFDIVGVSSKLPEVWSMRGKKGEISFKWWDEYIAASGVQTERARIDDAELVFVGYGIEAPEYGWDDYKGVDVSGKVLVMMNNDPDWSEDLFQGNRRLYYGRWTYKYEIAAAKGAVGAIIIHTTPSAGYPFQVVQTSWTGEQFQLPAEGEPRCEIQAWLSDEAAKRLMTFAGQDLEKLRKSARNSKFKPVALGISTSLEAVNQISKVKTANVLGLLRGSDPKLASEVVVITAHHDHLGIGSPDDSGDSIYNGALDNGTGMAQVLSIARAFTELRNRPRRSILFAFVAAEEQGLLGSKYYAAHPTFHPGKIAANINIDGGNIFGRTEDLAFVGYGKSSLDGIVEEFARRQGRMVLGDQFPDRGFFYRSDQFNLAKIGVPAFYGDNGTRFRDRPEGWGAEQIEAWESVRYHQPSDEIEADWNFDGMVEDARIAFFTSLAVAEADEMPTWKPGDEFEAARKEALAAAGN